MSQTARERLSICPSRSHLNRWQAPFRPVALRRACENSRVFHPKRYDEERLNLLLSICVSPS